MLTIITSIKLPLLLLLIILQTHLKFSNGFSDLSLNSSKSGEIDVMLKRVCDEKMGNCSNDVLMEEEFQVDSEINRRILGMQRKYISYETLKRDVVPCSTPGSSYYSCGATPANRYRRGCSVITKCARMY
ncbi:protein RALF-like 24 [Amaranthus tricolor]|uniref:protein RALF-like 24 n=1 Tax=Amaranthus tricolor TaxID=29722 RepID=UPI00258FFC84|nr:protein RALF-like 24 [Amaranthus tricolor]